MGYDDQAQPLTTTFADYLLPSATEVPKIEVKCVEFPSPLNPLGVKGVGESGCVPAAGAIVSAIEHALAPFGVRISEYPVTPARLFALLPAEQEAAITGSKTARARAAASATAAAPATSPVRSAPRRPARSR